MLNGLPATLRFALHWAAPRHDVVTREWQVEPADGSPPVPATLFERAGSSVPERGWVLLHGITRKGREHPSLVRFANALTATRSRVLVPEIAEWRELHFAPDRAQAILRGAVRRLAEDPGTAPGGVILMGVSFGAPQALWAAADPEVAAHLRGVIGWGGYGDLGRTVDFHFTGEHRWEGRVLRRRPDPYGRWVVGANCLGLIPEYADREEVIRALRTLATKAGDLQIPSWDPVHDPLKAELRRQLFGADREFFELFVPPRGRDPDPEAARRLLARLVPTAREAMPLLDPFDRIAEIGVPVRLLHGRSDQLIPYTETLELERLLEPRVSDLRAGVTGLFAHSGEALSSEPQASGLRTGIDFARVLRTVFEVS